MHQDIKKVLDNTNPTTTTEAPRRILTADLLSKPGPYHMHMHDYYAYHVVRTAAVTSTVGAVASGLLFNSPALRFVSVAFAARCGVGAAMA
ncbi:hypothetical protein ACH5RR_031041 [Cinchona calisaya]|uniref:Uncharacterized protein n=1 Tax=Cinchona calisaya TaxID=153742 RepID=A0ABD2YI24_9GENT